MAIIRSVAIIVIPFLGVINGYKISTSEVEKGQSMEDVKTTQDILDRYGDYVFDKEYVLHFPTGETLSFEKGVDKINNSPQGKFSPDGKYLAYTHGNIVKSTGSRGNDLIIYDISYKKSKKIQGGHRLIKNINWFSYGDKLYLLYNTFTSGKYDNVWLYIINIETARAVVSKMDWSFVDFLSTRDGIRYNIVKPGNEIIGDSIAKFENLLLFDVLMIPSQKAEKIIASRAKDLILTLKNKNMEKLSSFVHRDKGVRFSPYSYVNIEQDLVFSAEKIREDLTDKTKYIWGVYDGSGYPIEMTFEEYFKNFVYDEDFANAEEVGYNRIIGKGNTINNNFESYPGSIIVEYHFTGFDPKYEGMDWGSLRLVFEEKDKIWYLVGIIHDQWTI